MWTLLASRVSIWFTRRLPSARYGGAARTRAARRSPTTSARSGRPRPPGRLACRARSRCWGSRRRGAGCRGRRGRGRSPHARFVPRRQRVDLDEVGGVVPLGHLDLLAGRALAAAQAADPGVELALRAPHRPDLTELAAALACLDAVAEEVDAVAGDHLLDLAGGGEVDVQGHAVALAGAVDQVVGLGVEAPRVEREDRDVELGLGDHRREHLVLKP